MKRRVSFVDKIVVQMGILVWAAGQIVLVVPTTVRWNPYVNQTTVVRPGIVHKGIVVRSGIHGMGPNV